MSTLRPLVLTYLNAAMRIINADGTASPAFIQNINNAFANIKATIDAIELDQAAIEANQQGLLAFVQQLVTLNGLITTNAQQITSVDDQTKAIGAAINIANSFTNPTNVLTATSTGTSGTITVANHTRTYGLGSSVSVTGGTITGLTAGSTYYVYYSDPNHTGGTVTYQTTTNPATAAQIGAVHCVGVAAISSTADSGSTGSGSGGPGVPYSGRTASTQ